MEEPINEHDMTKKMLQIMNEGIGDEKDGVIELSGDERQQEEQKFREVLGNLVNFTVFNIYPDANNVVFGGQFQGMGGMEFQFTLEDANGVYVTANNMQLTSEVVETIQKLKGYYDNWKEEWANKLATEYR